MSEPTAVRPVPLGFYVSNSSDEDVFDVTKTGIYFRKSSGASWSRTDKWNFDHLCDVETVDATQGVSVDVDTHDRRPGGEGQRPYWGDVVRCCEVAIREP